MYATSGRKIVFGLLLVVAIQSFLADARPDVRKPKAKAVVGEAQKDTTLRNLPNAVAVKNNDDDEDDDRVVMRSGKDEKKKGDFIGGVLGGNIMDLVIVVVRAIFNPFNWREDLCKDQWSADKRAMENEDTDDTTPKSVNFSLNPDQLRKLFEMVTTFPKTAADLVKLGQLIFKHGKQWRHHVCNGKTLKHGIF